MATFEAFAWLHHSSHAKPEDVCPDYRTGIEEPIAVPKRVSKAERKHRAEIANMRDSRYLAFKARAARVANLERLRPLAMWYLFKIRNRQVPTRVEHNAWLEIKDSL